MGDVTRVLSGLEDLEMTGAVECAAGGLEVSVCVRPGTRLSGGSCSAVAVDLSN